MIRNKLYHAVAVLALLVLAVVVLVYAKPFLVPLTFAAVLSMLLLPMVRWLEKKGFNRVFAVLTAILAMTGVIALIGLYISWQISDIASDASKLEEQVSGQYRKAQQLISEKLGVSPERQRQLLQEQQKSAGGKQSGIVAGVLGGLGGFLTDSLLVLVYIFLLLFFRAKLKGFILRLAPADRRQTAAETMHKTQQVAQQYFSGLLLMIGCLWIMYGIGFTIAGVKNAFFFAILCGILEIIPFIGNLTGTALTVGMALVQGGGSTLIIGILITYALVQFIQTYILEPLVVGANVNINPLFTIIGIVAGETLWGIPGMILAIPLLGIAKVICDHVEPLKPYGYLIGEEKKGESGLSRKISSLIKRIRSGRPD